MTRQSSPALRRFAGIGALLVWSAVTLTMPAYGQDTSASHLLRAGDTLPRLTGEALSGRPIDIPSSEARKPTVVLFSFSREGGEDARRWSERLERDIDSARRPDILFVLEMEGVPRLIRGPVVFGIKRGTPPAVRDRMLVLSRDEALWRERLAVTATDHGYVVVIAPDGRIRWLSRGAYGDEEYAALLGALR